MYSAVKIGGKRLYKLARKGISIERPVRNVYIHQIELLSYYQPYVNARVTCSKGTYIRTLCDDIGITLGTGAHMTALKRSQVHNFRIEDSVSIAELPEPNKKKCFYSMDQALSHLGEIILDHDSWYRLKNGQPMRINGNNTDEFLQNMSKNTHNISSGDFQYVRLKSSDRILLGIGILRDDSLRVERLFNTP
jgi:tRNA pseudouridine55 synthase